MFYLGPPSPSNTLDKNHALAGICRAEFPAIRLHHKPWLKKSAHAETCSCKYVRYIHTTILICIHGIIHISHIINYKYIYIYVYIYVYGGFPTWGYLGTPPSSGDDTLPLETFPAPQSQGARSVVKAPWRDLLTFWSQMAWSDCHCMAFLS